MFSTKSNPETSMTQSDLLALRSTLTHTLLAYEYDILKHPTKIKKLSSGYLAEITNLANLLYKISAYYYKCIKVDDKVLLHHQIEKPSDCYLDLINTNKNLISVIVYDILMQTSHSHCLFAAERWIYILKLCFEKNDFNTCSVIVTALNHAALNKLDIPKSLSTTAQAIAGYLNTLILKPKVLHAQHEQKLNCGEQFIPALSALTHLLEVVEVQPDSQDKKQYIEEKKSEYSCMYQKIQTTLIFDYDHTDLSFIDSINKRYDAKLNDGFYNTAKTIKIKPNLIKLEDIMEKLNAYNIHDRFYRYAQELNTEIDQFHMLYFDVKSEPTKSIIQIMRDHKTPYFFKLNALKDIETKFGDTLDDSHKKFISSFKNKLNSLSITYAHLTTKDNPPFGFVKPHSTLFHSQPGVRVEKPFLLLNSTSSPSIGPGYTKKIS